jgi:HemY protein
MLRPLTFTFFIVVAATLLIALLAVNGRATIEAFGWRFDLPTGVAAFLVAAFTTLVVLFASVIKDVAGAPRRAKARAALKRRERGLAALTQGFNAAAAGDAQFASKQSALALKALGDASAARLLAAHVAQISGDDAAAEAALADLVDAPDTAFLALRALLERARAAGDDDAARRHAERAFADRPGASWAFDAVFDLALRRGDFGAARDALTKGLKSGAIDRASGERALAATIAALAYKAAATNDIPGAIADADAALKLAPGLAPAALLSARLQSRAGDRKRAGKVLSAAFAETGDAAVAEAIGALHQDEPAQTRADALDEAAALRPDAGAARLLRARALLLRDAPAAAETQLLEFLKGSASAPALVLMAETQRALKGGAAESPWFERAARAPRTGATTFEDYAAQSPEGFARIIRAVRARRPLVVDPAPAAGISDADLARLAPPSPPVAPASDDPFPDEAPDEALERDVAAARRAN